MAFRVIVAGLGARGNDWLREVRADKECRVTGCVDLDPAVLDRAASIWSIPRKLCFTELDEALHTLDCEAVIVATPPDCHARNCETALSFARPVLVEKPFALNLADANRIVEVAESKKIPIVVGQNYRYMRAFRNCRRIIEDGLLGRVGIVMFQYYRVPHGMADWLRQSEYNVLWGIAVHHLDALRFVLKQNVTGVLAESFSLPWSTMAAGASMQVMLKFEQGARGVYSGTYESSGHEFFEHGQEFYARFVGESATLHVFQRWLVLCEKGKLPRLVRRGARTVSEEGILLRQLKNAVLFRKEPEASGRDNLQTMAVVEGCIQSARDQGWKDPQELLAHS